MVEVKNVVKVKIKQLFCTHTAKEISEDTNYKILKDSFDVPYILRTCKKCEMLYKEYMIMAHVNMNFKGSITNQLKNYPKKKT